MADLSQFGSSHRKRFAFDFSQREDLRQGVMFQSGQLVREPCWHSGRGRNVPGRGLERSAALIDS